MLNYILMLVFLFVFPVILGKLLSDVCFKSESRWFWLLNGWIILFAIFEIISVPLILRKNIGSIMHILFGCITDCFYNSIYSKNNEKTGKEKNYP
mgnify:CR=1 FL=1